MRVYIVRTTGQGPTYEAVEATSLGDIQRLTRSDRVPSRRFDPARDEGAYIHAIACQGVSLQSFDHYAIHPKGGHIRLMGWNDDPDDWPEPWGIVWEFRTPRPDWKVGGRTNTEQSCTVYGNDAYLADETTTGGPVLHRPWSEWQAPPPGLTMHGVWTDDDVNERHMAVTFRGNREHGWRAD